MRFIVGVLIAIGLLILIFVLIFSGGGGNGPTKQKPALASYADTDTVMRMVIDGSVKANQDHRQIRVTVGRDNSSLQVIKGYEGQVIKTKSYDNNSNSYNVFLRALSNAGYNNGDDSSKLNDERGVCPLGVRYIFEIQNGSNQVQRYWTTSCGGGSFKGATNLVITLFQRQIPDYSSLTSNVQL